MTSITSEFIPLGFEAPSFSLLDVVSNKFKTLEELKSETVTVIIFICNHCPYVSHIKKEIVGLAQDYIPRKVKIIAINSNDVEKFPQDRPSKMREVSVLYKFPFPYLFDDSQKVAKKYKASCTPEVYIFNKNMKLEYHGQFDSSRPQNNRPVNGLDVRRALNAILDGEEVDEEQISALGCSIKWREEI